MIWAQLLSRPDMDIVNVAGSQRAIVQIELELRGEFSRFQRFDFLGGVRANLLAVSKKGIFSGLWIHFNSDLMPGIISHIGTVGVVLLVEASIADRSHATI